MKGTGLPFEIETFVRDKFRAFYSENGVAPPNRLDAREFGFGIKDKIDYRHRAFKTEKELKEFMVKEAPLFASYSTAYYELPEITPMSKKNWLGADLVFDLDAASNKQGHEHNPLLCEHCLNAVREDALRLKEEFLQKDFGFKASEITVVFSGQKGYHLHVKREDVRGLSSDQRKQLLAFVKGPASVEELLSKRKETGLKAPVLRGPDAKSKGWRGKFYRVARDFISIAGEEELKQAGLRNPKRQQLLESKDEALDLLADGNWDFLRGLEVFWERLFQERLSVKALQVDAAVTFDTARLIRLPGSLHGGTGFVAKIVEKIAEFEPWNEAIAFEGNDVIKVVADNDYAFDLAGESFKVEKEKPVELKQAAALFLLCKGKARLA
ncbi:MAG: DNA primase catalytic subunit PriS [Candidatus Micrarchaeota archaeon]